MYFPPAGFHAFFPSRVFIPSAFQPQPSQIAFRRVNMPSCGTIQTGAIQCNAMQGFSPLLFTNLNAPPSRAKAASKQASHPHLQPQLCIRARYVLNGVEGRAPIPVHSVPKSEVKPDQLILHGMISRGVLTPRRLHPIDLIGPRAVASGRDGRLEGGGFGGLYYGGFGCVG